MSVLSVKDLRKEYKSFTLDNVSFSLEKGKITGFIGRNGAGKSTTLKAIFGFVKKDGGSVEFFDLPFEKNEAEIKQRTGFLLGEVNYYQSKKISAITRVTKSFFSSWDDAAYKRYMEKFALDENKKPSELSAGMKVKYSLVLALSHGAELLILDEPTSGLDPVSRDELLDIFLDLVNDGKTVLFSTHITTDLERCADNIIYIRNGKIVADGDMNEFVGAYRTVTFDGEPKSDKLIGARREKNGYSALIRAEFVTPDMNAKEASLEDVMLHLEREG
ncbi:MAG: ABC transporter ATP-binding protein [Clostridia bacterium]|nr:ABC transporter ATP-binding protein [Clostridia bacterium]